MLVALVVGVAVLVAVVVLVVRSRRAADPVDSFRRQIDALSPEARRPTISQATGADEQTGGDLSAPATRDAGAPKATADDTTEAADQAERPTGAGDGDAGDGDDDVVEGA